MRTDVFFQNSSRFSHFFFGQNLTKFSLGDKLMISWCWFVFFQLFDTKIKFSFFFLSLFFWSNFFFFFRKSGFYGGNFICWLSIQSTVNFNLRNQTIIRLIFIFLVTSVRTLVSLVKILFISFFILFPQKYILLKLRFFLTQNFS